MSRFLHLRGFTGRPATIAPHVAAHAINPALQPRLSCIPALTFVDSYAQGDRYNYMAPFAQLRAPSMGERCAQMLESDLSVAAGHRPRPSGRARRDCARVGLRTLILPRKEIVAWLDGAYAITGEEMLTS